MLKFTNFKPLIINFNNILLAIDHDSIHKLHYNQHCFGTLIEKLLPATCLEKILLKKLPLAYFFDKYLVLTKEEALYLLQSLKIHIFQFDETFDELQNISFDNSVDLFINLDPFILYKYSVYRYFKRPASIIFFGFTIKPGLKFGSDFLLYKLGGPSLYHASASVIVKNLCKDSIDSSHIYSWNVIGAHIRVTNSSGKDFVVALLYNPLLNVEKLRKTKSLPLLLSNKIRLNPKGTIKKELMVHPLMLKHWDPYHNVNK